MKKDDKSSISSKIDPISIDYLHLFYVEFWIVNGQMLDRISL